MASWLKKKTSTQYSDKNSGIKTKLVSCQITYLLFVRVGVLVGMGWGVGVGGVVWCGICDDMPILSRSANQC